MQEIYLFNRYLKIYKLNKRIKILHADAQVLKAYNYQFFPQHISETNR